MTDFLIRLCIKDYNNIKDIRVRTSYGKFAGWIGIFCNVLLFLGKLFVGLISGSVAITADAINNLSDASSNVVSLIGFKLGSKPADKEHPYGHARYEYISGLTIIVMILVIGIELFKSSFDKIINPTSVNYTPIVMIILFISILVKLWMMTFNKIIGNKINSQALIATSTDSRNDVITTTSVLVASLISYFTKLELDGYIGLCVAIFILISGFQLVKDTIDPILGKAPDPDFAYMIQQKILSYKGVLGTHDLMIHDYGPGRLFASVHVEMAAEDDVIASHDVIDNIERDFLSENQLNIVIHYDPIITNDTSTNNLRSWISEKIKTIDESLTIHDLRVVPGTTHTNVIFDCVIPNELELSHSEVKQKITDIIQAEYPNYYCIITIDISYVDICK